MTEIFKLALIPVVILGGAWSFLTSYLFGKKDEIEKGWATNGFGWFGGTSKRFEHLDDPGGLHADWMTDAWTKFFSRRTYHNLKNLGQEWYELDSKRAYKASAFAMVLLGIFGFVLGFLVGVL